MSDGGKVFKLKLTSAQLCEGQEIELLTLKYSTNEQ